jgi:hypothetical protein
MDTTIYVKCNDIEKIYKIFSNYFGFKISNNELILQDHILLKINDVTTENEFTSDFLLKNEMEECNDFFRIVNISNFNFQIDLFYININIDPNAYFKLILDIFKNMSFLLNSEIVIDINGMEYFLINNGVEILYQKDNR